MAQILRVSRAYRLGATFTVVAFLSSLGLSGTAGAQTVEWTRQFGGAAFDFVREIGVDAEGNVYVGGDTDGLPGETGAGGPDAFVRKYNAAGAVLWTRQFGTAGLDFVGANGGGLTVGADAVYIAGFTTGAFAGFTNAGGFDAFLRKYDTAGNHLWTRQYGTAGFDDIHDVAVDKDKAIYVAGSTVGALPGQTHFGDSDAVVRRYSPDGTVVWTRQVGTSGFDHTVGIAFGSTGVYVVGNTDTAWPGQTASGGLDALVLRFTRDGELEWARQFGTAGTDVAFDVAADDGGVYVVGGVSGALPGQTFAGVRDAFVRNFNPGGQEKWTRQFGTPGFDQALGASASGGALLISGAVSGALPGQTYSGGPRDGFVRRYDAKSGDEIWTHQFGSTGFDTGFDTLTTGTTHIVYVGGFTDGALPGQINAGLTDGFLMKLVMTD